MDLTRIFGLLLIVVVSAVFGEDPMEVKIAGDAKQMVSVGDELSATCVVNRGITLIMTHQFEWYFKPLADPEAAEQHLATGGVLETEASPDDFTVEMKKNEDNNDEFMSVFKVKAIKKNYDGMLICRVAPTKAGDEETLSAEIEVAVKRDADAISLTFPGETPVTGVSEQLVEKEEGDFKDISCTASGFAGPAAEVNIYLDDEKISDSQVDIELEAEASKEAGFRKYTGTTTVAEVDLKKKHKKISCKAKAAFDGAKELEASFPLHIVKLLPTITCVQNSSAHLGDKYVQLKCIVDHQHVKVDSYAFEIEDGGETITEDGKSENFHELRKTAIDSKTDEVVLDLYQAKKWHFETKYYLDVYLEAEDGEEREHFRADFELMQLPSSKACSVTSLSLGLVLSLSALLSMVFSL